MAEEATYNSMRIKRDLTSTKNELQEISDRVAKEFENLAEDMRMAGVMNEVNILLVEQILNASFIVQDWRKKSKKIDGYKMD